MRRTIRLMADYHCWPLWSDEGNLDPAALPLSTATQQALLAWACHYDSWLDLDDPAHSPPVPAAESAAFDAEGERLWLQLRHELGAEYEVIWQDNHGQLRKPGPGPS